MTAGIWFALAVAVAMSVTHWTEVKADVPMWAVFTVGGFLLSNLVLSALAVGGVL